MMRKFRVWDKKVKDWRDLIDDVFIDSKGEIILRSNGYFMDYGTENLEISYSTGLKDRLGREIYEGDIIRIEIKQHVLYGELGEVIFFKGFFGISWINDREALVDYLNNYSRHCEIIGNIYENPELLKKVD